MKSLTDNFIKIIKTNLPDKPTLILDIDDTIIDSKGEINYDVLNTYNIAKSNNINIFIITARPDNSKTIEYTYNQMENIGIKDIKIFFMPYYYNDIALYKHNIRKLLTKLGYNIIAAVGDMYWDFGSFCLNNFHIYRESIK
jgi:predicted secreted acid phosphatase